MTNGGESPESSPEIQRAIALGGMMASPGPAGQARRSSEGPSLPAASASAAARVAVASPAATSPGASGSVSVTALVRSPWDYVERYQEFLGWLRWTATVTRVVNPAPVIEWNLDKRYLRHLSASGVPMVPTLWASADSSPGELVGELRERGWRELVVKPAIGAGGCQMLRTAPHAAQQVGDPRRHRLRRVLVDLTRRARRSGR